MMSAGTVKVGTDKTYLLYQEAEERIDLKPYLEADNLKPIGAKSTVEVEQRQDHVIFASEPKIVMGADNSCYIEYTISSDNKIVLLGARYIFEIRCTDNVTMM